VNAFEKGILSGIQAGFSNETIHPDYKQYISPALIRRMSPIVKMGVTAGLKCVENQTENLAGIIVGTGLGCLRDTEVFLKTVLKKDGLAISPTAFIQSTHNTIAGQLALSLGNKGYNMTHSHQEISFETALNDALLLSNESNEAVLVGACEEHISFLDEMANQFGLKSVDFGEGASFFKISTNPQNAKAKIESAQFFANETDFKSHLEKEKPSFVLYRSGLGKIDFNSTFPNRNMQEYCGMYATNSAFGLQLACELVSENKGTFENIDLKDVQKVAVVNFHGSSKISLTTIAVL
jgi:hypothetical protein